MTEIAKDTEVFLMQDGEWVRLPAEFRWTGEDPIAASVIFGEAPQVIAWVMAFEMLACISKGVPNGVGDVRFDCDSLDGKFFLMRLNSPDGQALLRLKVADVTGFVHAVTGARGLFSDSDFVRESLEAAISAILEGTG